MVNELRGGFVLLIAFTVFTVIIAVLVVGSVMRPRRWSERPRLAA